jgi:uncharacterized membrane protein YfcA
MLATYLIIGALSGFISGLFGIGGGIIMVPALEAIFTTSTFIPTAYVMHMAIGTSLATMIFTTLSGAYAHIKRGAIRWNVFKQIMPAILIGVVLGAIVTHFLPSHFLKIIFGLFLVMTALRIIIHRAREIIQKPFSREITLGLSVFIGALASILGAGGGTMVVPFLMRLQLGIREALGTSLACGVLVSLVATVCFMLTGFVTPAEKIAWSTGYIYWPAFLGIVMTSVLFASVGVRLAHKLSISLLKKIFAVFLLVIACYMIFFSR